MTSMPTHPNAVEMMFVTTHNSSRHALKISQILHTANSPLLACWITSPSRVMKSTDHVGTQRTAIAGQKCTPLFAESPLCVQPLLYSEGQDFPVLLLEVPEHRLLAHPEMQREN